MASGLGRHIILFAMGCAGLSSVTAQHETPSFDCFVHEADTSHHEIHSLQDLFLKGRWGGHVRNYFMYTDHSGDFKSQYADGIGMKIHFNTASYKGFDIGIGGIFTFDLFSSDLAAVDPISGRHPAFELQLFDVNQPDNKHDLDRLEELYLRYSFGEHSTIIAGRQEIITPFVNPADGRMKPYAFQGLSIDYKELKATNIFLSFITHVSPRSTVEWYSLEESIGVYNEGLLPSGEEADYHDHIKSNGLLIFGFEHNFGHHLHSSLTLYHADNVLSTGYARLDWKGKITERTGYYIGLEGLLQGKAGNGGNEEERLAYMCDQDENYVLGGQIGLVYKGCDVGLAALHLGDRGRFLFPREWGRENFYVTIPRGRVEGMGDGALYRFHFGKEFKSGLNAALDLAHFEGPGTENVSLNKYKTPNYNQVNLDLGYKFHGWCEGLALHFLYVHKEATEPVEPEIVYYQADYNHYNLIMNLIF